MISKLYRFKIIIYKNKKTKKTHLTPVISFDLLESSARNLRTSQMMSSLTNLLASKWKEIGIRKILEQQSWNVLRLLAEENLKEQKQCLWFKITQECTTFDSSSPRQPNITTQKNALLTSVA